MRSYSMSTVTGRDSAGDLRLRTPAATAKPSQFPTFAMDMQGAAALPLFQRLGIKGVRQEFSYIPTTSPDYEKQMAAVDAQMKGFASHGITVMLTIEGNRPSPDGITFRSFSQR